MPSFEKSDDLEDGVVLTVSNKRRCLLWWEDCRLTLFLCFAVSQCCCTLNRFPDVTLTSHTLQKRTSPSVLKSSSPNSLTKLLNFALSHLIFVMSIFTAGLTLKKDSKFRFYWNVKGRVATCARGSPPMPTTQQAVGYYIVFYKPTFHWPSKQNISNSFLELVILRISFKIQKHLTYFNIRSCLQI